MILQKLANNRGMEVKGELETKIKNLYNRNR